jgi:ferritin-like metal-binding protein YciE
MREHQVQATAATTGKSETSEHLVEWLRDAHAAEKQSEKMLSMFCDRLENYPALKAQIKKHIEETRGQAERLEDCLKKFGKSASALKDLGGKFLGMSQSLSGAFVEDEVIKGVLASYTFEHMEIASYRIIIAAADACGDGAVKRVCEGILAEEVAMAEWLDDHMHEITEIYLARADAPGVKAKH